VFISVHDVERALGLPVLAAVPLAGSEPGPGRRQPVSRLAPSHGIAAQAGYGT
jgi:hypothetical protein